MHRHHTKLHNSAHVESNKMWGKKKKKKKKSPIMVRMAYIISSNSIVILVYLTKFSLGGATYVQIRRQRSSQRCYNCFFHFALLSVKAARGKNTALVKPTKLLNMLHSNLSLLTAYKNLSWTICGCLAFPGNQFEGYLLLVALSNGLNNGIEVNNGEC
jgi:hypothetical protein